MPMQRYTIDPANFTDGQWEELYNANQMMPRTYEARHTAKPFKRPKKSIRLAILACHNRAEEVRGLHDDETWAADLEAAAETLRGLIGEADPHCQMCGANEGEPHHDAAAKGKIVTLHRTTVDGEKKTVCMLCRNGLYAMRRDAKILESCPKCGGTVTRGEAFVDTGEGPEAGRTFYYCSEHCRETH